MHPDPTDLPETYERLRPELDTGDLVLFGGQSLFSSTIKWMTTCRWSHVGMVVRVTDWEALFLWESTLLDDLRDLSTGTLHKGVQLVLLSDRLRRYAGEVAVRRLFAERTPRRLEALRQLRSELRGRPWEESRTEMVKAIYDGPGGGNEADLSSLFCSELVAAAYMAMGLLPADPHEPGYRPANEYTPADFAPEGGLRLLEGRLGEVQALRE